jgi:hypothetical protein
MRWKKRLGACSGPQVTPAGGWGRWCVRHCFAAVLPCPEREAARRAACQAPVAGMGPLRSASALPSLRGGVPCGQTAPGGVVWPTFVSSVNWSLARMLQLNPASSCASEATTPFWSGHWTCSRGSRWQGRSSNRGGVGAPPNQAMRDAGGGTMLEAGPTAASPDGHSTAATARTRSTAVWACALLVAAPLPCGSAAGSWLESAGAAADAMRGRRAIDRAGAAPRRMAAQHEDAAS